MKTLLAAIALPFAAWATPVDLSGKVYDNLGRPLFRASVALARGAQSTITLPDGSWRIGGDLPVAALGAGETDTLVYTRNGQVAGKVVVPTYVQSDIGQVLAVARDTAPSSMASGARADSAAKDLAHVFRWRPGLEVGGSWPFLATSGTSGYGFRGAFVLDDVTNDGLNAIGFFAAYDYASSEAKSSQSLSGVSTSSKISIKTHSLVLGFETRGPLLSKIVWNLDMAAFLPLSSSQERTTTVSPDPYKMSGTTKSDGPTSKSLVSEMGPGIMFTPGFGVDVRFSQTLLPWKSSGHTIQARGRLYF